MTSSHPQATVTPRYYIGLMSGTSADGIDLALVTFDQAQQPKLQASYYQAYDNETAKQITALYNADHNEIDRAFALDIALAKLFAKAIMALLKQAQLTPDAIIAIGSHGQTIRHRPEGKQPFTLQIGCCQTLATLTNIRVIGQFRKKDMVLGGQGAPLVPAFHQIIFAEQKRLDGCDVFVVNIGGIANLTFLPASSQAKVIGYDTGTGNALIDDWFKLHHPQHPDSFDRHGQWAATGVVNQGLLTRLLADEYFQRVPPKSTGREYFNLAWLEKQLRQVPPLAVQDVQATLVAFTAHSLVKAISAHSLAKTTNNTADNSKLIKVYVCGGGVHNHTLVAQIKAQLHTLKQQYQLLHTKQKGIDGDQLEAMAFAWLALAYDKQITSNMPAVTGASKACTLGVAFFP